MPVLSWEDIAGGVNAIVNLEGGTTHDMGGMSAAISFVDQSGGSATAFTSDEDIYVGSQGFDSDSSLRLYGTGGDGSAADPTITTTIDFSANSGSGFSDNVSDVSFRIDDLDVGNSADQHKDILTVRAYDANGNEVEVTLTPTSSMVQDGNTVSGNDIHYQPTDAQASLLVEINGPVSKIVIEYANGDVTDQQVNITDINYSTLEADTDNIVDGTSGDDTMLVGFVDGDNDTIDGADGDDDTILGYDGNDSIDGGEGDDLIYGGAAPEAVVTGREVLEWDDAPGYSDEGTATGFTQNTGETDVTFSIVDNSGTNIEWESANGNVDGIDSNGVGVDQSSGLAFETDQDWETATVALDFSDPVGNVDFRINDVDFGSQVTVRAFDADGNEIPVVLAGGSDLTLSDTDGVAGNDTATSNGGGGSTTDADYSVLVQIEGPVARIEIDHMNINGQSSHAQVTDVYFDTLEFTGEGADGNDTITGGNGDDVIYGMAGDDVLIAGVGDELFGGSGDDTFTIDPSQLGTGNVIEITGGETDETAGDTLDLTGLISDASAQITLTNSNPDENGGLTGTATLDDGTVVNFTEIENILSGNITVDGTSGDDIITPTSGAGGGVYVDAQGDSIDGADGDDDLVFGYGGDDTIDGGAGNNTLFGGTGDDVFIGGEGADSFQGNAGQDNIDYSGSDAAVNVDLSTGSLSGGDAENDTILGGIDGVIGSEFDDTLTGFDQQGTNPADTFTNELFGGGGDDTISGLAGDDLLDGGDGDDAIFGGAGDDSITGGAGSDTVEGGDGNDVIDTSGPDTTALDLGFPGLVDPDVDPFNDRDVVYGGAGNDTITTGDDADTIFGGTGDDVIDGGIDADSIDGGDGNDTIIGGEGSDVIDGGAGDDVIYAALDPSFPDSLNIPDEIDPVLNNGDDLVHGGTGNDTIYGADDNDTLHGDEGDDVLYGGIDDDHLFGGQGEDQLFGGDASDTLDGGDGSDVLDGGRDDDTITVGAGDVATGGHGDDVFTIDASANDSSGTGPATINIVGGETGEANQPDNDDTTNDNFPGAPNEFGDVLDLTNLFASGLLNLGDINYDDPSHESGNFTYTDDDGDLVTVNFSEIENVIVCFTRGTMIVTDKGEKAIEDLEAGDKVMTKDNGLQELRWVGSRAVPAKDNFAPIMIKAGAMANDRDLLVSPQHRMVVEGWKSELLFGEREVLAAAKHLVNGDTIYVQSGGMVEYFHMLFDTHEIVFANGAASESFHPGELGISALTNEARDEIFTLFPELRNDAESYGPAARTSLKGHEAKVLAENPDFLS